MLELWVYAATPGAECLFLLVASESIFSIFEKVVILAHLCPISSNIFKDKVNSIVQKIMDAYHGGTCLYPSTQEAEIDKSQVSLRPAYLFYVVSSGQPVIFSAFPELSWKP